MKPVLKRGDKVKLTLHGIQEFAKQFFPYQLNNFQQIVDRYKSLAHEGKIGVITRIDGENITVKFDDKFYHIYAYMVEIYDDKQTEGNIMKPTKRQIAIAEHWIKKESKRLMKEGLPPDWNYYKSELEKIVIDPVYGAKVRFFSSGKSGSDSHHIALNDESIPIIINWLKKNLKKFPKASE